MNGFGPLLRKELLEQWRTRRLLVVTVVFVALGIGSPFLARYTPELIQALGGVPFEIEFPEPTTLDAIDQFLKNLGQVGILSAILLAMGSVATEKERGTAALLLSKPASRAAYSRSAVSGSIRPHSTCNAWFEVSSAMTGTNLPATTCSVSV